MIVGILKEQADAAACQLEIGLGAHRLSKKPDDPGRRFLKPHEQIKKRRFAASIRPDEADLLFPAELEIDAVEHRFSTGVGKRNLFHIDDHIAAIHSSHPAASSTIAMMATQAKSTPVKENSFRLWNRPENPRHIMA